MSILSTLRRVYGAVHTKDVVPVLTHFHIRDRRVQGFNGTLVIDAPCEGIGSELDLTVPASLFLKAVDAADGEPQLKILESGRLRIKKGNFRVSLPLLDSSQFPRISCENTEERTSISPLLEILRSLVPFMGEDATRPWACGIFLDGTHAYATNNVTMARVPLKTSFSANIPSAAVLEILRIGETPISLQCSESTVALFYEDGTWLRTNLIVAEWPDVETFFTEKDFSVAYPDGLWEAVEKVLPFCLSADNPIVSLSSEGVSTEQGDIQAELEGLELPKCRFRADVWLPVLKMCPNINLAAWPAPVPFSVNKMQGLLMGLRGNG